jgi:hypothetical protein
MALRHRLIVGVLSVVWITTARADAPGVNKDLAANAALYYWQAINAMPKFDAEKQKLLDDWKGGQPPPELQKQLTSENGFLRLLHRGAQQARCEWAVGYEDGENALFGHLFDGRMLAKWACWRARARFEAGQYQAGVDDIIDALTLARHLGSDPLFLSIFIQYQVENLAIDEVASYLTKMDAAALKNLAARLDTLPQGSSIKATLRVEKEHFLPWFTSKLEAVDKDKPDEFLKVLVSFLAGTADDEGWRTQVIEFAGQPLSREKVFKEFAALAPYYDYAAGLMETPWSEWRTMLLASDQELLKGNPANPLIRTDVRFANVRPANPLMRLTPALGVARLREARTKARWAMFKAAIAVVQGGREKLKDFPDPYGDGPFEYRPLENGFELESKIKGYKTEPWGPNFTPTLTVGQRKKE